MNRVLIVATIAAILGLGAHANAQFEVNEADGIAASPRVRQMLSERKAAHAAAAVEKDNRANSYVSYPATGNDTIAASPKVRQILDEREAQKRAPALAATASNQGGSVAYQPVGNDGIAASPKLRQQLNERGRAIMVAPVK